MISARADPLTVHSGVAIALSIACRLALTSGHPGCDGHPHTSSCAFRWYRRFVLHLSCMRIADSLHMPPSFTCAVHSQQFLTNLASSVAAAASSLYATSSQFVKERGPTAVKVSSFSFMICFDMPVLIVMVVIR
jgi:hypothetical protein